VKKLDKKKLVDNVEFGLLLMKLEAING